jgi:hypothetical protein
MQLFATNANFIALQDQDNVRLLLQREAQRLRKTGLPLIASFDETAMTN